MKTDGYAAILRLRPGLRAYEIYNVLEPDYIAQFIKRLLRALHLPMPRTTGMIMCALGPIKSILARLKGVSWKTTSQTWCDASSI